MAEVFGGTQKNGKQLNDIICRKYIDRLCEILNDENRGIEFDSVEDIDGCFRMSWFRIPGGTKFWQYNEDVDYSEYFANILSGIKPDAVVSFVIDGDEDGIGFYVGISDDPNADGEQRAVNTLMDTYKAFMPGIELKPVDSLDIDESKYSYGGIVMGYPIEYSENNEISNKSLVSETDSICRAMLGCRFTICVTANKVSGYAREAAERIIAEKNDYSSYVTLSKSESGTGRSIQKTNYDIQDYINNLDKLYRMLRVCEASGTWAVNICFCSDNECDFSKLSGVIKASYCANNLDCFESVRCIPMQSGSTSRKQLRDMVENACVIADEGIGEHPGGPLFSNYRYQTIMDSGNLARFIMLPQTEFPGYYLDEYVQFDMAVRHNVKKPLYIGNICRGGRGYDIDFKNRYDIELEDLTRHALIIGITGGGKTNTSKALLSEIYQTHNIPFLVIESAKREYIELMNLADRKGAVNENFKNLMLFTLGGEGKNAISFRINPFEIQGKGSRKVSIQTHIDYLLATFKASFELYPPMPYVLETSVYEVYEDRGWDIVDNENKYGWDEYPTLSDLYYKIEEVVERMNYDKEVKSNVKAALQARVNSLRIGGKGAMLDVRKSVDIEKVLKSPVVMELEDIGDDDIKSFVIGVLLVQLYEYRKSDMGNGKKPLQHVLMIEEAHRLLKNVTGENNPRANSVEFFCNMLAEIRTFGQGILIADQIPTKLAPDTIKNTNLKIVHRTVMKDDREAIGHSMNMNESQIEYLSSLKRGCAAVYSEGDNKPKLVMLPLKEDSSDAVHSRDDLLDMIRKNVAARMPGYSQKFARHLGCMFCRNRCSHYEFIDSTLAGQTAKLEKLKAYMKDIGYDNDVTVKAVATLIKSCFKDEELDFSERMCLLGYALDRMKYEKYIQYVMVKNYAMYLAEEKN